MGRKNGNYALVKGPILHETTIIINMYAQNTSPHDFMKETLLGDIKYQIIKVGRPH